MKRFVQIAVVLVLCAQQALGSTWTGILPTSRAYQWENYTGLIGYSPLGTLPSATWTQSGSTIAPCGTSGAPVSPPTCGITAAISTANGTSQYVLLGIGDFYLNAGICLQGDGNVEIRGSGPLLTRLHFSSSSSSSCPGSALLGFESSDTTSPGGPPAHICTATAPTQGSTTMAIGSGCNNLIVAGVTEVVLDQCATGYTGDPCTGSSIDNSGFFDSADKYAVTPTGSSVFGPLTGLARPERFQAEAHLVVSCSPACGTAGAATLTLDSPIAHPNYASGNTPEIYLIQPGLNVGIQNLMVDASQTTNPAATEFYNMANVWMRNVEIYEAFSIANWVNQTIHADITSNYCYNAGQSTPSNDPSCFNHNWGLDVVINNLCQGTQVCTIGNGPEYGSLSGYNDAVDPYTGTNFMFSAFQDCHSDGCDYNLLEGNCGNQADEDQIHGTHLANTFYRNCLFGWTGCNNGQCGAAGQTTNNTSALDDLSYNRYINMIGNILGTPGIHTTYQSLAGSAAFVNQTVLLIGNGNSAASPAIPGDSIVGTTVIRWGNWDVVTNATRYCTANATPIAACTADERGDGAPTYPGLSSPSTTFPPSFFYTSRPAWWSQIIPFPAIGPDVSGGNLGIVAGACVNTGNQSCSPAINGYTYGSESTSSAWSAHINAIPSLQCFLVNMGGLPDGTGSAGSFDANSCYQSTPTAAARVF